MRAITFSKLILRGLTLMLLHAVSPSAMALEPAFQPAYQMDALDGQHKKWVCQYTRESDGVLYMLCDDLASLMYDDLTLDGENQPSKSVYFPLWGAPSSDGKALELAHILLCNQQPAMCSVELASRGRSSQIAMF